MANLTVALNSEGKWVNVDQVPTGLACNCFCPYCRSPLIAKNSNQANDGKIHHFAHKPGSDCTWSDESTLHKLAKEVLVEEQIIMMPILDGESEAKQLKFDHVEPEYWDEKTGLIPDCLCIYGSQKLWVEFKRSHEVDTRKTEKIKNNEIDCIEVDLNECPIDKESVRHFIVEDSKNRIWVYNSTTHQTKTWKTHKRGNKKNYYVYHDPDRHLAFDEEHNLINLLDKNPNYDYSKHKYYCINCGKELRYIKDCFEHVNANDDCSDEWYLINAAKEIIRHSFHHSPKYEISLYKNHSCRHLTDCIFANKEFCCKKGIESFDLKSLGYTICEKSSKKPGQDDVCDIIFKRNASFEDDIIINLTIPTQNKYKECSFRQIVVPLVNENDVIRLFDGVKNGRFLNFKNENDNAALPNETSKKMLRFSLFESGKTFIEPTPCSYYYYAKRNSAVQEYIFDGNSISSYKAYLYSLLLCYESNKKGCYCHICSYLKDNNTGNDQICIRYKTQGTPMYPLVENPCNCPAFSLNEDLTTQLKLEFNNRQIYQPQSKRLTPLESKVVKVQSKLEDVIVESLVLIV